MPKCFKVAVLVTAAVLNIAGPNHYGAIVVNAQTLPFCPPICRPSEIPLNSAGCFYPPNDCSFDLVCSSGGTRCMNSVESSTPAPTNGIPPTPFPTTPQPTSTPTAPPTPFPTTPNPTNSPLASPTPFPTQPTAVPTMPTASPTTAATTVQTPCPAICRNSEIPLNGLGCFYAPNDCSSFESNGQCASGGLTCRNADGAVSTSSPVTASPTQFPALPQDLPCNCQNYYKTNAGLPFYCTFAWELFPGNTANVCVSPSSSNTCGIVQGFNVLSTRCVWGTASTSSPVSMSPTAPTAKPTGTASPTTNATAPTAPTTPTTPFPTKPTTKKPTTKTPHAGPTTRSPVTSSPTKPGGLTPIGGLFIFLLVAGLLVGIYQFTKQRKADKVRDEQDHAQGQAEVSVI